MSDPEPPKKKSWGCLQWVAVMVVVSLLAFGVLAPTFGVIYDNAFQSSTVGNARQIVMAMKIYANDNDGVYPDSKHPEDLTANQVFRELFREEVIVDERVFGAICSRFLGDGKIGEKPDFAEAVASGENHWALVAGQGLKTLGYYPLVFENAVDSTWPPKWDPKLAMQPARGRTWRGNKIIVGFSDNSVSVVKLEPWGKDGKVGDLMALPKEILQPKGKAALPNMKVLDIEGR